MSTAAECDYGHRHAEWNQEIGQVRRLPTGGGSAVIVCQEHYRHELAWRRERNKDLGEFAQFDLPAWESLAVYPEPEEVQS